MVKGHDSIVKITLAYLVSALVRLPLPFTRLRLRLSDRDSCEAVTGGSELMWKYSMSIRYKYMHAYLRLILTRVQLYNMEDCKS